MYLPGVLGAGVEHRVHLEYIHITWYSRVHLEYIHGIVNSRVHLETRVHGIVGYI